MSEGFFDDFYDELMASSESIKKKFVGVDLENQKALLKNGLSYMIMLNKGSQMANSKVDKLGVSHSKEKLDIEPWMYDHWKKSLLATIQKHDTKIGPSLLKDWDELLQKGIDRIVEKY
ncbi:MAG: globin [Ekhidna sp.]|nr:globin [Ekhidna sp.]